MSWRTRCTGWGGLLLVAASAAAWGATEKGAEETVTVLRCEPVYMPARQVWAREVELVGRNGRLSEVRIDGLAVYTFAVRESVVLTSQDNERIQIDMVQRTWRSDFRGQANGEGRCELVGSP